MKRLFAIILALSMLIAMLPVGTVLAADTETEKYEYIFTAAAIGESAKTNIYTTTSGKFSHGLGNVVSGNAWKGLYALGSAAKETVMVHTADFLQFAAQSTSEEAAADDNAVVFELYLGDYKNSIPANPGVYIPTVENGQHGKQYHYGITDLYLVSSDAVKENGWNVNSLEAVQTIIDSAAKLGSGKESPMADVIHLSSDDGNMTSYENKVDFFDVAKKVKLDGGNYYLIATVSKPATGWKKSSSTSYTDNEVFGNFSKITFTREADDKELTAAFTAKEEDHTPAAKNVYGYKSTDTTNVIVKHEAVATNKVTVSTEDTENFLFWAQGLTGEKKILSFEPSFEYTPSEGNNILIAVYEDDTTNKAEFFNANGQREAVLSADGKAPALPERVGYESAGEWVDLEGNTVKPGDAVTVSGYSAYVPNYGELISVTVNGALYNYGDTVTLNCNDAPYYEEGKYFKGWKKDDVIVSTSETYSFLAYKETTVEPVWAAEPFNFSGSGRKIILDAFGDALMAEFIGFENVLEKGIMLDDTKLAMKTDSNQFVIIPDKAGTYKGYAIIEDDGAQKLVTDGEHTEDAE